jgi:glutamyl/glutaminyl-tRNA synthetase
LDPVDFGHPFVYNKGIAHLKGDRQMYTSITANPRAQRAILDEFFPVWRDFVHDQNLWTSEWSQRTGAAPRSARRWYHFAVAIADAELHIAA